MTRTTPKLLLIEDDLDTAALIRETLADHFGVDPTTHVDRATKVRDVDVGRFDIVLSDVHLPDGSGLELIEPMLRQREDLPIVMVTSESALDVAMEAIRRGAYDYIVKSGDYLFTIPLIVEKNLAVWQMKRENLRLESELKQTLDELRVKNQQLEEAVDKLEQLASTDPLTGLANRRNVQQTLDRSFAESNRYGSDLSCLMIDLDGFKKLNDNLGHQMGDRLLQTTAKVLRANCRRCDMAGRYGGDEFVLLLPHTAPDVARQVAKRIQAQFAEAADAMLPEELTCNMSVGIACVSSSRPANADQLVALADAALYRAKQAGKACIFLHEPPANLARHPHPPKVAEQAD